MLHVSLLNCDSDNLDVSPCLSIRSSLISSLTHLLDTFELYDCALSAAVCKILQYAREMLDPQDSSKTDD